MKNQVTGFSGFHVGCDGNESHTKFVAVLTMEFKPHLDLYRVNSEVNNLKPFACLAFLRNTYVKTPQKQPIFGDELVTSFFHFIL